jgi:hypothetical protein
MDENLHSAICLLALITQRPPDLDKLLGRSQTEGPQNHLVRSQATVSLVSDPDSNLGEHFNTSRINYLQQERQTAHGLPKGVLRNEVGAGSL